jgi:hypothetical protein
MISFFFALNGNRTLVENSQGLFEFYLRDRRDSFSYSRSILFLFPLCAPKKMEIR